MTYTVQAYLSGEGMQTQNPALTEIFRTEPGEQYTAAVRAEARRRVLARQCLRPDAPQYTHLTCRYTPNA